jgi:hypothetical protein
LRFLASILLAFSVFSLSGTYCLVVIVFLASHVPVVLPLFPAFPSLCLVSFDIIGGAITCVFSLADLHPSVDARVLVLISLRRFPCYFIFALSHVSVV